MKRCQKILSLLLVLVMVSMGTAYATTTPRGVNTVVNTFNDRVKNAKSTSNTGTSSETNNLGGVSINPDFEKGDASKLVGVVLGFIQYIGYAVAVGMLLYIGIKYMMASAADKADLKKGAINYVIGAVLIGGASTVAGFLVSILGS